MIEVCTISSVILYWWYIKLNFYFSMPIMKLLPHLPFSAHSHAHLQFESSSHWTISTHELLIVVVSYAPSQLCDTSQWISVLVKTKFIPCVSWIEIVRFVGPIFVFQKYFIAKRISYFKWQAFFHRALPNPKAFFSFCPEAVNNLIESLLKVTVFPFSRTKIGH